VAGTPAAIAAGRSGRGARLSRIHVNWGVQTEFRIGTRLSLLKHPRVTRSERPGCLSVRGIRRRCHRTIEWWVSSPTERNAHSPDKPPPRARRESRAASFPLQRACRFQYPGPMDQPRIRPAARLSSTSRSHPLFPPIVLLRLASHRMHETYRVAKCRCVSNSAQVTDSASTVRNRGTDSCTRRAGRGTARVPFRVRKPSGHGSQA
jgi:hypothetical protein